MKFWNIKIWSMIIFMSLFIIATDAIGDPLLSSKSKNSILRDTMPAELGMLKKNVIANILSQPVDVPLIKELIASIKSDGTWEDIDYKDKTRGGWPVNQHLERLLDMARVYTLKNAEELNYSGLEQKIEAGLNFWLKNDLKSPNWWYPQIGTPKVLGPLMLLMENKLTAKQLQKGVEILNRSKIGMTGQNKVWLSGNVIYRSLLTDDAAQIDTAATSIEEEVIVSENEGIQPDFSYQLHGPQQQFGNYGNHFAEDISKWAIIFQNTPFQFKPEKIEILRHFLMKGLRWVVFKGEMDISACGRELFPNEQIIKANTVKNVLNKMPQADPAFKDEYKNALNFLEGNKHFWRSDMSVHRRKNFFTSVKMSSNRVVGAESCNSENTQGYHLGDGATYFYQSGEEYTNIFPFWNWKQIPGTTAYNDAGTLPVIPCINGYRIASDFVGGVSDGENGIATLAYNRDSIKAQKAWFYIDDAIVCLGSGITASKGKEVNTTINQSFLHGNILVKENNTTHILDTGAHEFDNLKWMIHDNWGYAFPEKENVKLTNRTQTGDWHNFVKRMPSEKIEGDIFTLWIDHQLKPQNAAYAYFVFPSASEKNIGPRTKEIKILENSAKLQAIEIKKKKIAGFVFAKAGEANSELFKKVSVDKPCILLLDNQKDILKFSIADPTHFLEVIKVGIQGRKISTVYKSLYDKNTDMSFFNIPLPTGSEAGKSVYFELNTD